MRLGLSATAASAVLYSAIVLFGVGSASPSAPGVGNDQRASVVLVPGHSDTVAGSVQRLPQASPEPGRHRSRVRRPRHRVGAGPTTSPAESTAELPPPAGTPRGKESVSPSVSGSSPAPVEVQLPSVAVPPVPVPELPLPELPLPELPTLPPPPVPVPLNLPG